MVLEKRILVSLLRLLKQGSSSKELLGKDAGVPVQVVDEVLEKLCADGLCQQRRNAVDATSSQRVKVAVRAIRLGADFERVSSLLQWKEFENLAAEAFKASNYSVRSNFRFKHADKRFEIDLLACKEPLIVCVDCKHWHRGWSRAAIVKVVEMQTERTRALVNAFPVIYEKARLDTWKQALVIPTILSLTQGPFKFHSKVPVVPILQIQNFLNELPANTYLLTHYSIKVRSGKHRLTEYLQ